MYELRELIKKLFEGKSKMDPSAWNVAALAALQAAQQQLAKSQAMLAILAARERKL